MIKIKKSLLGIIGICATTLVVLNACESGEEQGRQTIDQPNRQITVIDPEPAAASGSGELEVGKIDTYEQVSGLDWLDEDSILASKENPDVGEIHTEGITAYPGNLLQFDLDTSEENYLLPEKINQGFALYSPNKEHIFHKTNVEESATGYIMKANGSEIVQFTEKGHIHPFDGSWIDNEHVIYSIEGIIYQTDLKGNSTKLADSGEKFVMNVVKAGNKVYFTTSELNLVEMDLNTQEKRSVAEEVVKFKASPDFTQFAVVKGSAYSNTELYLLDEQFNEITKLAEEYNISGLSWSPDGKLLAYAITSSQGTGNGVFVTEIRTEETTQIPVNFQYSTDSMVWNPSGTKLLTTVFTVENDKIEPVTYITTLK